MQINKKTSIFPPDYNMTQFSNKNLKYTEDINYYKLLNFVIYTYIYLMQFICMDWILLFML